MIGLVECKTPKYIIHVGTQLRWSAVFLLCISLCSRFRKEGHWGAELQWAISFAVWAGQVNVVLVYAIAVDLVSPIFRMCAKLPKTLL